MASGIYTNFKEKAMDGTIDLDDDIFKVGLLDSNHTFTHTNATWANVCANQITGATCYAPGGISLTGVTWVTSCEHVKFDACDAIWTGATFTANHAVIYHQTSSTLVCSVDFSGDQTVTAGTFTIQWNSSGILRVS